ncbi:hypothetical protein [Alteraurantiacibacter palmitatis]|uniref:Energy transducer TonB n=1 Tax=Alteraurantiacibacter palmitatis TaxID=2054628 RepID=A0ABV7E7A6_9SPHN
MAFDPHQILRGGADSSAGAAGETGLAQPLGGTRRQRIQRLQFGLFGLSAVLLMVGLANIIIASVEQNRAALPEELPPVQNEDVPRPRDPLANAGVVPELPAGSSAEPNGAATSMGTDPAAVAPSSPASPNAPGN